MPSEIEYPCPECGHDGPHRIVEVSAEVAVIECASCSVEVDVRLEPEDAADV